MCMIIVVLVSEKTENRMKIIECTIPFIVAVLIIYYAYIREIQGVSVLASSLALYAARGYLRGEKNEP